MDPVVKSRTTLCKVRGKNDLKKKYVVEHLGKTYCVIAWPDMSPIIYDMQFDDELSKYVWCWHAASGVAYSVKLGSCGIQCRALSTAPREWLQPASRCHTIASTSACRVLSDPLRTFGTAHSWPPRNPFVSLGP